MNGCVAIHALNATRYSGRNRFSATRAACLLPLMYAPNHALNVVASPTRYVSACWNCRFAATRVADAFARLSDDSVPHLAAEKPDQAAMIATAERRIASQIEMMRSCLCMPPGSPACFACSPISLPTSVADRPSRH